MEDESWAILIILPMALLLSSPLWVPIAFVTFAIGRRRFGLTWLLTLITIEAALLSALYWYVTRGGMFVPIH